jgi:hypothetical protein
VISEVHRSSGVKASAAPNVSTDPAAYSEVTVALAAKIACIAWVVLNRPGATHERRDPALASEGEERPDTFTRKCRLVTFKNLARMGGPYILPEGP